MREPTSQIEARIREQSKADPCYWCPDPTLCYNCRSKRYPSRKPEKTKEPSELATLRADNARLQAQLQRYEAVVEAAREYAKIPTPWMRVLDNDRISFVCYCGAKETHGKLVGLHTETCPVGKFAQALVDLEVGK